jgi:hypothetical protein
MLITTFKIVYERSKTLLNFSPCSTLKLTFSTSKRLTFTKPTFNRRTSGHCLRSPWWWRQQGPLKRWQTSTRLHGATTQKTAIWADKVWALVKGSFSTCFIIFRCFLVVSYLWTAWSVFVRSDTSFFVSCNNVPQCWKSQVQRFTNLTITLTFSA